MAKKKAVKTKTNKNGMPKAIAALVLGAIMLGGGVAVGFGWGTDWTYKRPHAEVNQPDNLPEDNDSLNDGSNLIISDEDENNNGIRLATRSIERSDYEANGISERAETAYTLTATVYDVNGSVNGMPQRVNAVASWKDDSMFSWANGKNVSDYITITRTSDNSFIVTCLKDFGEPILITVTAEGSDKSAVKRCDYVKRLYDIEAYSGNISVDDLTKIYISLDFGGKDGTLEGNTDFSSITFGFTDDFIHNVEESSYYKYFAQCCENKGVKYTLHSNFKDKITHVSAAEKENSVWLSLDKWLFAGMDEKEKQQIEGAGGDYLRYAIIDAAKKTNEAVSFELSYRYSYNDVIYSEENSNFGPPVRLNTSMLGELPAIGSVDIPDPDDSFIF